MDFGLHRDDNILKTMTPMKYLIIALCLIAGPSYADSIEKLNTFAKSTRSARADFTQTVLDKRGTATQQASGTMEFSRPGKFRWSYSKPYAQAIVGDGKKLWIYDAELNQVSVKPLDAALGSSPAALLAGSNAIERNFTLKDVGMDDGLEWLEATPKAKDTSFERIRMGFSSSTLAVMELKDSFGQTTVIRFANLQRNPKIAANTFKFTPPKGTDVIGE